MVCSLCHCRRSGCAVAWMEITTAVPSRGRSRRAAPHRTGSWRLMETRDTGQAKQAVVRVRQAPRRGLCENLCARAHLTPPASNHRLGLGLMSVRSGAPNGAPTPRVPHCNATPPARSLPARSPPGLSATLRHAASHRTGRAVRSPSGRRRRRRRRATDEISRVRALLALDRDSAVGKRAAGWG